MSHERILQLDPVIHAPIRLAILSVLVNVEAATFSYLKEAVGTTDGNLSTHLTKLEGAGLIKIEKTFVGKKPQTSCSMTKKGRAALKKYLQQLQQIIEMQKTL